MGRLFLRYLSGRPLLECKHCGTQLANPEHVISKDFHGTQGPAYLIDSVINCKLGQVEERVLITGRHLVMDVSCVGCQHVIGWKYKEAYELSQRYKENKYILEKTRVSFAAERFEA